MSKEDNLKVPSSHQRDASLPGAALVLSEWRQ